MDSIKEFAESLNDVMRPLKNVIESINEAARPFIELSNRIKELLHPIYDKTSTLGKALSEAFKPYAAARKLGEAQYVYWDYIDSEFIDMLLTEKNTNKLLRERNEHDRYSTVERTILQCSSNALIEPHKRSFLQSIQAYRGKSNDLAVVGLLTVLDGLLTDISGDQTTSIFSRVQAIMERVENNESLDNNEVALLILLLTLQKTIEILSAKSDFTKKEPKNLNRHWILHGRSRRRKTKLDCIKLINLIYGILLVNDYADNEVSGDE